jgi:hypothetical protein
MPSGKPLDPYYLPLFANGAVLYSAENPGELMKDADVVLCLSLLLFHIFS